VVVFTRFLRLPAAFHAVFISSCTRASSPQQITSNGLSESPYRRIGSLAWLLASGRLTLPYERRADIP
jgi:hypothetical protein